MSFDQRTRGATSGSKTEHGASLAVGKQTLTAALSVAPVQLAAKGGGAAPARETAQQGIAGVSSSLPHLDLIQRAFGQHDVSLVNAHVGGEASEAAQRMGAQAYATGDHVAFQKAPDLHLAAHEAAHVVQQRGGVQLAGGVGRDGDPYEHHADAVADQVVQGKSAEALLDVHAGKGGAVSAGGAVQRKDDPALVAFKAATPTLPSTIRTSGPQTRSPPRSSARTPPTRRPSRSSRIAPRWPAATSPSSPTSARSSR